MSSKLNQSKANKVIKNQVYTLDKRNKLPKDMVSTTKLIPPKKKTSAE